MARPQKCGMDYFPHDTDALTDEKIEALRMLYGNDGYAFYFILLERIYRTEHFELDISDAETRQILSRKIGVEHEKFESMLLTAIKRNCFNPTDYQERGVLTSAGIKRRADIVVAKRESAKKAYEARISVTETTQETTPESTQSKVKKSKVKKSKEENNTYTKPSVYFDSLPLNNAMLDFIEHRKQIKKSMTEKAIKMIVDKVNKFNCSEEEKIKAFQDSIINGWQGVFEPKSKGYSKPTKSQQSAAFNDYYDDGED